MSKYAGQISHVTSPKGVDFSYWFGVKAGKRWYLVTFKGGGKSWQFSSMREVQAFIKEN